MKRDILAISGGTIALGAILWIFWGAPVNAPRAPIVQQELAADPALKLITERSPYMRTER